MHFVELGRENKETLVLLHGFASNKESWESQHVLSEKFHLIIPDHRGHGESELYSDLTIKQFASDVLHLLDELKINQAHFCGLSMGGFITQEIYRKQPHRVKSMILSNTASYFSILTALPKKMMLEKLISMNKELTAEERLHKSAKKLLYHFDDPKVIEAGKKGLTYKEKSYHKTASMLANGFNYLPMLPFVKVPILIISSMWDNILPMFYQQQTYFFAPKCRTKMVIFKESGHVSNIDEKEKYNEILTDFIMNIEKRTSYNVPYLQIK